jgi:hypothetical protein
VGTPRKRAIGARCRRPMVARCRARVLSLACGPAAPAGSTKLSAIMDAKNVVFVLRASFIRLYVPYFCNLGRRTPPGRVTLTVLQKKIYLDQGTEDNSKFEPVRGSCALVVRGPCGQVVGAHMSRWSALDFRICGSVPIVSMIEREAAVLWT